MLTGVAAFPETTLTARVEGAATPVARPDGVADATWAVLARALASDPADRYADGAAIAAELHRLPGVPAAAVIPPDPSAPTEVIALPVAVASPLALDPAPLATAPPVAPAIPDSPPADVRHSMPLPAPAGPRTPAPTAVLAPRKPSRSALAMAGIVGGLTLALVVGMASSASRGNGRDPAATAASATPAATAAPTPSAEQRSVAPSEKPPKDGKGKGKGKGGGD
jgi:hypothetical protein